MPDTLRLIKCRCKSQFCKDCALAHCVAWREKLRPALSHWKSVLMLTATVDPKQHESPWEAMELVGKRRAVGKLIARLHKKGVLKNREFTSTLEFHKSGWPHWHLLVDSRFVCKHLLQKTWGLGHCWVSKHDFKTVEHAINYATKYIVKTTEEEGDEFLFPAWCYDYKGNIRRFSTSRGLCPTRKIKNRRKYDDDTQEKRARITKTNRQKVET